MFPYIQCGHVMFVIFKFEVVGAVWNSIVSVAIDTRIANVGKKVVFEIHLCTYLIINHTFY